MAERISETAMFRTILGTKPLGRRHPQCRHHSPGSNAYWECFVRHNTISYGHLAGTCKMGAASDNSTVVDPQLRYGFAVKLGHGNGLNLSFLLHGFIKTCLPYLLLVITYLSIA